MYVSLILYEFIKSFNLLNFRKGSQGDDITYLSLPSGKHSRAMYSGDYINLSCKRSDLCQLSSVRTLVILKDHLADSLLLILVNSLIDKRKPLFVVSKLLCKGILEISYACFSFLLLR